MKTKIPGLTLRFAEESDTELILELIKELAEYEKLSHEVVADTQVLRNNLFKKSRTAVVVIADYNNEPVGFALFFHNFSTFLGKPGIYLEDIFVKPEFRGKRIGKTLLAFLAETAKKRDCGRLEWSVLDWNEPAINFYKKLGAKPMDEWTVFRLSGKGIDDLAGLLK